MAVFTIPDAPAAFWNSPGFVPLAIAGFMSFPYTLIFLPIAFSVSFYRAISSDDHWGGLKGRWRFFAKLVAIGAVLWSSIWVSGAYIA